MASQPPTLPTKIPVFPLTGTLLLPRNFLPLHIFEPRYRHMVEDALSGDRIIGMIQPLERAEPSEELDESTPELYRIGCAGRIEEHRAMPDGRSVIALRGVSRFRVEEELEEHRGYRQVRASYEEFPADLEEAPAASASEAFFEVLQKYAEARGLTLQLDRLKKLPEGTLINGLSMALPFLPVEKQALLEAGPDERAGMLEALLAMGAGEAGTPPGQDPDLEPLLN